MCVCITLCVVKLVQTIGIYTRLAQLVERWPLKPVVVGSSPTGGVCFFASLLLCGRVLPRAGELCMRVAC